MFVEVFHFLGDGGGRRAAGQRRQRCFQLPDYFDCGLVLELPHQWFEPRLELVLVLAAECPAHRRQVLHGVVEVQALAGVQPAVVGQPPDPHRAVAR